MFKYNGKTIKLYPIKPIDKVSPPHKPTLNIEPIQQ